MTKLFFRISCIVILIFLLSPLSKTTLAGDSSNGSFEVDRCMFPLPTGVTEGDDVICGYLTVSEEHSVPNSPSIQIAVAIIKSTDAHPKPDPLFMAQGGPGGSTIDTYAERLLTSRKFISNRDIVLFDQRGTFYSKPNLICTEVQQLVRDTIDDDLSEEESLALELKAYTTCRERLLSAGINLSAYNSLENAADIDALRQALGYEKINLYGVSYGTLLALHVMQNYPQALRSVILDSVVPPQINFNLEAAQTMNRAFTKLFTACEEDPDCNRDYPELEKIFYQLYANFEEQPIFVPMTDYNDGKTYNALFDGESLQSSLFQMMYASSIIPALPRMIYDIKEGNYDFLGRIMSIIVFDRTYSDGMYFSVICAEDADFKPEDQPLNGIRQQIIDMEENSPEELLQICRLWDVKTFGPELDQAVYSDIPTLLLSGNFDPITPPSYAQAVSSTLSRSYLVNFPANSHGIAMEGECQDSIIQEFIDNPDNPPNTSCVSKNLQPEFYTSKNVIEIPVLIKLLNLDGGSVAQLLILLLSLFVLLTSIGIFPIVWLATNLSKKYPTPATQKPPLLVQLANWIAALNGITLLIFIIGITYQTIEMLLKNDNRLFFGLPATFYGWFFLPLLSSILTILMLTNTVLLWKKGFHAPLQRLYYTALSLSAVLCIIILAKWNMLATFLF